MIATQSPSVLRIAQITDLHLGSDKHLLHGVDVYRQLSQVLTILEKKPLDLLVLSGDLALNHGEAEAYQWLRDRLANFPAPYVVMAGNHDVVATMGEYFAIQADIQAGELYFSRVIKGLPLLFLDTSSYYLPPQQLAWLRELAVTQPTLLFMHHPPIFCGCTFMDNRYSLKNKAETWAVLQQKTAIQHIFCGHYHTDKVITQAGKQIYLTPSTMLQIAPEPVDFQIAHTRAGWREIVWDGAQLKTWVSFLD
ncbi:putative phosphohydrolase [Beggiatoa alba B18LD]|uniref:Putative phosphohydrolase n=1 Tax=Beggiatoa alba B18LD TaxID=395493 RepID=I3CJP8_9GAMM|nr:metallophosphoesterase [Beggiatoa alba]EIJ43841.1 putative phosphohydrolase [Beggiatoa alba B18LD]